MWNISLNVLGLSKVGIKRISRLRPNKLYSTRSTEAILRRDYNLSYAVYLHLYKQSRTQSSSSSTNSTSDEQDQSSSFSSSHQQYTRQRYEQRRSEYESSGTRQGKSSTIDKPISDTINHYQRLNIESGADLDTIKSAYYSMSKLYHPDIVGTKDESAAENFRLITESYDTLSNPEARANYDRQLAYESSSLSTANPLHSANPETKSNPLYRTRDADLIFRSKLEAAAQREKLKNPRRFRAGAFKSSTDIESQELEIERLQKRLVELNRFTHSATKGSRDGSDFYKHHLYQTLHRKQSDLLLNKEIHKSSKANSSEDSFIGLITFGAIFALTLYSLINLFLNIDFAAYLDERLKSIVEEDKKDKGKAD